MEIITCIHNDVIKKDGGGVEIGTCRNCGQVHRYTEGDPYSDVIVKLGRIDGKLVMPKSGQKLKGLTPEETRCVSEGYGKIIPPEQIIKTEEVESKSVKAAKPVRMSSALRIEELAKSKDEILKDYQEMSMLLFFKKWGINSVLWMEIRALWKVAPKGRRNRHASVKLPLERVDKAPLERVKGIPGGSLDRLPPFPTFKDFWPFTVQEKWFEVYLELRKLELENKQ